MEDFVAVVLVIYSSKSNILSHDLIGKNIKSNENERIVCDIFKIIVQFSFLNEPFTEIEQAVKAFEMQ